MEVWKEDRIAPQTPIRLTGLCQQDGGEIKRPAKNYAPQKQNPCKYLIYKGLSFFEVVWGGIEPPTQGFSVLCSTDWATAPYFNIPTESRRASLSGSRQACGLVWTTAPFGRANLGKKSIKTKRPEREDEESGDKKTGGHLSEPESRIGRPRRQS